jgi:putative SOS response-associated peptidase YedK
VPERTELDELFDYAVQTDEWDTYYHHLSGFSFRKIPVLTAEKPDKINAYNWGLISHKIKNEAEAKKRRTGTLNAKSETIFELTTFKDIIDKQRCLIFINGFFEPHTFNKKKYSFYLQLKEQKTFALAGLYDSWVNKETGEIVNSCSIITIKPEGLMAKIHNKIDDEGNPDPRSPLILEKENMYNWIKPDLSREQIIGQFKELSDEKFSYYPVSQLLHSRKEDTNQERVKERFLYPELDL